MSITADPSHKAVPVTPSDSVSFTNGSCRALYVGVAGHVVAIMENAAAVTFSNVPVGILPVRCTRVNLTGTTASAIVALY